MTELLKQIMNDQADRLEVGGPDLEAILEDGRSRARKRRIGIGAAGLVVAAAAAAIVVPMVSGGGADGDRAAEVAASDAPALSWADGSVIHVDGETIDVGHEIHAYVESDAGYLLTDPDQVVWSWVDGTATRVGQVRETWEQTLVADGPRVGWLDVEGDAWDFVVIDQRTGERTELEAQLPARVLDGDDDLDEVESYLDELANVSALDGTVLYGLDGRGVISFDTAGGDVEVLASNDDGLVVDDVENGRVLFSRNGGISEPWAVAGTFAAADPADLSDPGAALPVVGGDLSPDGRRAMSENSSTSSDDFTMYDVDAARPVTVSARDDYDFFTGFAWLDVDTYLAVGMQEFGAGDEKWTAELLTCVVSTDSCQLVADGPPAQSVNEGSFQLPIGSHIG